MTLLCINVRCLQSNEIAPSLGSSLARMLGEPFSWSDGRWRRRVRRTDSDTVTVLLAEGHQLTDSQTAMHYNFLMLLISFLLCSVVVVDSQTFKNRRIEPGLTFAESIYITFSGACKYTLTFQSVNYLLPLFVLAYNVLLQGINITCLPR